MLIAPWVLASFFAGLSVVLGFVAGIQWAARRDAVRKWERASRENMDLRTAATLQGVLPDMHWHGKE